MSKWSFGVERDQLAFHRRKDAFVLLQRKTSAIKGEEGEHRQTFFGLLRRVNHGLGRDLRANPFAESHYDDVTRELIDIPRASSLSFSGQKEFVA